MDRHSNSYDQLKFYLWITDRVMLRLARYLLETLTQHFSKKIEWSFIEKINHREYLTQRNIVNNNVTLFNQNIHVCTIDTLGMYLYKILHSSGKHR